MDTMDIYSIIQKGLAYKTTMPINFCTSCKVGLANEEVVNGVCERCGSPVIQKEKSEWMLKITEYAQRLIDDLDNIDYLEKIKTQQRNWIGRSEGAEVKFKIKNSNEELLVYTTRPDTLFGATYMVIAPEHSLIKKFSDKITNLNEINEYQNKAALKSDFERYEINKDKTGVEIKGLKAINPLTKNEIPIWISDYVLSSYGTGAIMAVPAHDSRDYEFATKFELPIIQVWWNGAYTLHLLYSRFLAQITYDIGVVQLKGIHAKRIPHGMILGTNGEKNVKIKRKCYKSWWYIVNEFGRYI